MLLIIVINKKSKIMNTFVPNKSFYIYKKTDSECLYIEVWLADQNSNSLEIEDKINVTLVVN